jgi:hypothetical protein
LMNIDSRAARQFSTRDVAMRVRRGLKDAVSSRGPTSSRPRTMDRRTVLAGAGATALLLATGCAPEASQIHNIDLTNLGKEAPKAVIDASYSTVKLLVRLNNATGGTDSYIGSGFVVGKNHVITSGHALRNEKGQLHNIAEIRVLGRNQRGDIINTLVRKGASSYRPDSPVQDVAILETGSIGDVIKPLPVRKNSFQAGEHVAICHFGPASNGSDRDPTNRRNRAGQLPAIVGGASIAFITKTQDTLIFTDRNWGRGFPADQAGGGASGGPVLDKNGNVIGIVVAGVDPAQSAFEVEEAYKLRFLGIPQNQKTIKRSLSVADSFTANDLALLQARLAAQTDKWS